MNLFERSISGALLIIVVVIVRAVFINKLPKKTFMVLWGIVLGRLLLPFKVPFKFSIYSLVNLIKGMRSVLPLQEIPRNQIPNIAVAPSTTIVENANSLNISPMFLVWIAGVIILGMLFIATHLRCRKEYKMALPTENAYVKNWLDNHKIKRTIKIVVSDKITAPLTYGVWKPVILLPKTFDFSDEQKLGYILTHEYTHIRHFDIVYKWILVATLCLHWFNPLVWVMYILANRDLELSCDENVVQAYGNDMKSEYAFALIGLEEKRSRFTSLVNNFSKNAIEERIVAIMKSKKTSMIGIIIALVLVVGVTTVFATSNIEEFVPANQVNLQNDADVAIEYEIPNMQNNHGSYSDEEYEEFLSLKTPNYDKQTVRDFNLQLAIKIKENPLIFASGGFNENTENLLFFKSHNYSLTEIIFDENGESEYSLNIGTATNKNTPDGTYYGAGVSYTIYWAMPNKDKITVEERDNALNGFAVQFQTLLESKDMNYLSNNEVKNTLQNEANKLCFLISNDRIHIRCEIEEIDYVTDDSIVMTHIDKETGIEKTSTDNGKTWLTASEYEKSYPTPVVEWYTYEEYKAFIEEEKVSLNGIIGEKGWNSTEGWYTWTRERVDKQIASYEDTLEDIKNGVMLSKTVDGSDEIAMAYDPKDAKVITE